MHNSNFGYDCRNNIDSCSFKPIFDNIKEFAYIQKCSSLFHDANKDFFYPVLMMTHIEDEYNRMLMKIDQNDPFADAKRYDIGQKRKSKIDTLESHMLKSKRKKTPKTAIKKRKIF